MWHGGGESHAKVDRGLSALWVGALYQKPKAIFIKNQGMLKPFTKMGESGEACSYL